MDNGDVKKKSNEIGKAVIKGIVSEVPLVGGIVSEIWGYIESKAIENRIDLIEEEIKKQNLTNDIFKEFIEKLDEHKYYFVRNNFKYYFLNCIPESTRELCQSIIKYIKSEDDELQEEICETIQQLNVHDINFIEILNAYLTEGIKDEYTRMKNELESSLNDEKSKYHDRNIIYSNYTVFMKDINNFLKFKEWSLVDMLNGEFTKNENKTLDVLYFGKSIIKLQNMGLLQTDFVVTMGTASVNNIDRIHVTLLGQKVLECFANNMPINLN